MINIFASSASSDLDTRLSARQGSWIAALLFFKESGYSDLYMKLNVALKQQGAPIVLTGTYADALKRQDSGQPFSITLRKKDAAEILHAVGLLA